MIAHVAPLLRLRRDLSAFDYRCSSRTPLPIGSIVRVTFRHRAIAGVVVSTSIGSAVPPKKLLDIDAVITRTPLLPPAQHSAALYAAKSSYSSLATTFASVLPAIRIRDEIRLSPMRSIRNHAGLRHALDALAGPGDRSLVTYLTDDERSRLYQSVVTAARSAKRSCLFIAPTLERAERLAAELGHVVLSHHGMSETQFRSTFLLIRNTCPIVVIGTRSAIFSPIRALGAIMIDDEDADGHIQDEPTPHFDVRDVAGIIGAATGAKVVCTSKFPSLASWTGIGITKQLHPQERHRNLRFIHLDREYAAGNRSLLAPPTVSLIRQTFQRGGRVAILHEWRSTFRNIECQDCGFVPLCPTCHVPSRQLGNRLACSHCGVVEELPTRCPRCRGIRLRGHGRGVPELKQEVQSFIPTNIASNTDERIVVRTAAAVESLAPSGFSCIVLVRFESLLAVPRVDAEERARRLLYVAQSRLRPNGTLVIQGSDLARTMLTTPVDDRWRKNQQNDRDRFGYPPAWNLVLLRQRSAPRSATRPAVDIAQSLRDSDPNLTVTGPQPAVGRSPSDRSGTMILIRSRQPFPPNISTILEGLDENWTIMLNPLDIR